MHKTDADRLADLERVVRKELYRGFFGPDELVFIIPEGYFWGDEAFDNATIQSVADRVYAEKVAEMATWPEVTDCDRLDAAFAALDAAGIICEQNAGLTKSDGVEECEDTYEDEGGDESHYVGYCYYTGQDLDAVMACGEFCIGFGHWREKARGVEIAERICAAMREQGFEVEWGGSIRERICVKGITWRRR